MLIICLSLLKISCLGLAPGPNAKELDDVQKRKGSRQFPERFKSLKGSLADAEKGNVEDVRLKCLLEKYKC